MKVIKIDVVNKDVYYVHINKVKHSKKDKEGSYLADIYKHLECRAFDVVQLAPTLDLYIDDEGLLIDEPLGAFKIAGSDYVFSGHGLMVGNNYGDTWEPPITIENAKKAITFCDITSLPDPFTQIISE